jgi:uncharacterized zinc-type alcohol dehydrogenase-like protein
MRSARAFAAFSATSPLAPHTIQRRDPKATDVAFDIEFCGVCHSDLHTVKSEWAGTVYPCVPGHELVGRVTEVGSAVTTFRVGDRVGVGCMVDSCRICASCSAGLEQYCDKGDTTFTYNSVDKHGAAPVTYGGYSSRITVDESFCLHIPENLPLDAAAPLLCAGITTYSPLRHWGAGPGRRVGVVGLGGLGHMAVKLAHAMGAEVVLFTGTAGKADDARRLGADHVVLTRNADELARHTRSLDLILDTVSASHNLDAYTALLKRDGALVLLGAPEQPHPSPSATQLIFGRRSIAGSVIGGIAETQEMLDFCGQHGIVSEIETIPVQQINVAYERMLKSDVKYRFVIDISSLGDA